MMTPVRRLTEALQRLSVLRVLLLGLALVLAGDIVWSWPAMQDDALIHLRYADVLLRTHRISYDGRNASFGDSSLLYVALLACLRAAWASALLPRFVSSLVHAALFAGMAGWLSAKMQARRMLGPWGLLLLILMVLPSAVRWLDDGMETPLMMGAAFLLALAAHPAQRSLQVLRQAPLLVLLGACCVLLRVEMLAAVLLAALMMYLNRSAPMRIVSLVTGGLGGAASVVVLTGHLLPDTAVAKAFGAEAWRGTLATTRDSFAGALGFGLGLLALWLLTFAVAASGSRGPRGRGVVLLANCLFPGTLLIACLRGQTVPGIRYFAWMLLFSIVCNIIAMSRSGVDEEWRGTRIAAVLCCLLAAGSIVEARMLAHVFMTRGQTLARLRSRPLGQLRDLRTVAFDVGYIGYFTGAPVCDLAGLVNGRASARMDLGERTRACAAQQPQLLFLNRVQMGGFQTGDDLSAWSVCGTYDFGNLHSVDLHYLAAAPEVAARVCHVSGESAQPVLPLVSPNR